MSQIVGYSARRYPTIVDNPLGFVVLSVLCKRVEGTYKVYSAIVPDNSVADPHYEGFVMWVQRFGNPARFVEARMNFPSLKEEEYST
jgi:hypothetical protein